MQHCIPVSCYWQNSAPIPCILFLQSFLSLSANFSQISKKMCPVRSAKYERQSRTAVGHALEVEYIAAVMV